MKVSVSEKEVKITEMSVVCEGDCCVNKCFFALPKSFDGLSVTAVFGGVSVPLVNGECFIPSLKKGNTALGVYAYKRNGEELKLMYSPKSTYFYVEKGSFTDEISEEEVPEISRFEEFCGMLASYCTEQIKDHCNLKKIQNPKIGELDCGIYCVCGDVVYSECNNKSVDVQSGVLFVFSSTGDKNSLNKNFYLFADAENVFKGTITVTGNESCGNIEKIPGLVEVITKESSEKSYPSAKAVYDFVLKEYVENSDRPLSAKVVKKVLSDERASLISNIYANTASSLKSEKNGSVVKINDVSALPHKMSVELKNIKNLCSLGTVEFLTKAVIKNEIAIPKGKYVFSAVISSTDTDKDVCVVYMVNNKSGYSKRLILPRSLDESRVVYQFEINDCVDEFVFYSSEDKSSNGDTAVFKDIKIEEGTIASEYTPYIDLSGVDVSVLGKNLFKNYMESTVYSDGSSVTVNDDGSLILNMVDGAFVSESDWIRLPAGTYTISDGTRGNAEIYLEATFYSDKNDSSTMVSTVNTRIGGVSTVTTTETCDVKITVSANASKKGKYIIYPQIEVGDTATQYEQYKIPKKYFSSEKGTLEVASEYPNTTVLTDVDAININVLYNRDISVAFDELKNAIISLGGNV